ncbi:hypothetical protein BH20ACI3_BH20ACI3_42800 [soil metagenome]
MKLPLPTMVLFLFSRPRRRTPLAVIAKLCLQPQKNQPLWLASSTSGSPSLAAPLFFFLQPHFPAGAAHSSRLFKLQIASNPA